jgi:hypothetical protein
VIPQVRQLFERLSPGGVAADANARFEHFRAQLWPRIKEAGARGATDMSQSWPAWQMACQPPCDAAVSLNILVYSSSSKDIACRY